MQPHLLSFLFAIILILRKLHYDIEFYNERRQAKVGLLRYMMRFDSLGFMFPILRSAETQTEQQIISKANRSIYLAYAMLVLTLIIVSTSTI